LIETDVFEISQKNIKTKIMKKQIIRFPRHSHTCTRNHHRINWHKIKFYGSNHNSQCVYLPIFRGQTLMSSIIAREIVNQNYGIKPRTLIHSQTYTVTNINYNNCLKMIFGKHKKMRFNINLFKCKTLFSYFYLRIFLLLSKER
jgi:hypothetical protein